ncbi:hypothetical protein FQN49_001638 [Arthroderma sp. PD_2]|nr:hypothetical protein FQN49_001638 [Arthroderma sp. PD_2]
MQGASPRRHDTGNSRLPRVPFQGRNAPPAERPSGKTMGGTQERGDSQLEVAELRRELNWKRREFQKQEETFQNELLKTHDTFHKLHEQGTINWSKKVTNLELNVDELTNEVKNLKAELATQKEQVRIAQERAFKQMEDAQWTPLEDSDVRAQFKGLENAIRVWSKEYPYESKSGSQLPTDAELSVIGAALQEPLYGAGNIADTLAKMSKFDEAQAHWWRCQTLRLHNAITTGGPRGERITAIQEAACEELADRIIGQLECRTYDEYHQVKDVEKYNKLLSLLMTASKLSGRLWSQKTYMDCIYFGKSGFKVNSPYICAHRLQKLDADDTRLDGHALLATIQPAIIAYGDCDGENYDERKVWLKGIVFVEE